MSRLKRFHIPQCCRPMRNCAVSPAGTSNERAQHSVQLPAGCRSLCIIDEFGKGTLTADGVGLLCATLRRFAEMAPAPKVVACTHFSEVMDATFLPRRIPTSCSSACPYPGLVHGIDATCCHDIEGCKHEFLTGRYRSRHPCCQHDRPAWEHA